MHAFGTALLPGSEYDRPMPFIVRHGTPLIAAVCALLLAAASPVFSQSEPAAEEKKASPLVEAARATKKSKQGPKPKITINDKNLKRTPAPARRAESRKEQAAPVVEVVEVAAEKAPPLAEEIAAAVADVSSLEKELLRLEQRYYDESDPSYREKIVRKRFDEAKRQLAAAREKLATLRSTEPVEEQEEEQVDPER